MSKIQESSLYYRSLIFLVGFPYRRFFRQIEVRGAENIPTGVPVIFAANHQNALMDALAILFFQKKPVVFMARADMFQNPVAAKFLRSLKITPIYRIRDGFENLSRNERQMKGAVDVLLDRGRMCLMPEGNQGHQHKLRPLVKGLVRIAYMAEEQLKDETHVNIVPIGIDYNYYRHAGSDLVVTYGQPIEVKDSIEAYKENQANGLNLLREKLAESLSSLMHDIRSTTNYDKIYRLCCMGTPAYLQILLEKGAETDATTLAGLRFDARRNLGLLLDRLETENPDQVDTWDRLCQNLKKLPGSPAEVSEWMDERRGIGFSALFAISTLILFPGFLLNLPAWLIARFACSKVEDTQMHSTFSFVLGMFVNALVYILVATFICLTMQVPWMLSIVTFIFVFVFGSVCERVRQSMRLHWRRLWYSFGKRGKILDTCKKDYEKLRVSMMEFLRK